MKYCIQYVCCLNTCITSPYGWSLSDCSGTICLELLLQDGQKGSRFVRYLIFSSRALLRITIKSLHYIYTRTIYKTHTVQTHPIISIYFFSITLNTHCNYHYTAMQYNILPNSYTLTTLSTFYSVHVIMCKYVLMSVG